MVVQEDDMHLVHIERSRAKELLLGEGRHPLKKAILFFAARD
jgi:hypothetical protein